MPSRPYWTGQIRLSLVTLPVQLFSAVRSGASSVDLDQIDRNSGERIHHQNVLEDGTAVEREDIVKGFKLSGGDYVLLEQDEIEKVRLSSSEVFELVHFIDREDLPVPHLEKPYYAVPDGKGTGEIYGVIRDALKATGKVGIGQIALRGREELCALMPHEDGLMVEILRYVPEVKEAEEFFSGIKAPKARGEYLDLAKKLIEQNSGKPNLAQFEDHYHTALMELIHSKEEDRAPVYATAEKAPDKVIDLMAALRNSLKGGVSTKGKGATKAAAKSAKKAPAKKPAAKKAATAKPTARKAAAKRKRA